jgi:magnesium transporter
MIELKLDFHALIENKNWKTLKREINRLDAVQIADIIEDLPKAEDIILFRLLTRE